MGETGLRFIDSNIFLELFLNQEKAERCRSFLQKVFDGEHPSAISDFVVYSCLLQLEKKANDKAVSQEFLLWLLGFNHLTLLRPSFEEMFLALSIEKECRCDFDDALIVSCMKGNGITKLVSFDKHFDSVEGITRIEP